MQVRNRIKYLVYFLIGEDASAENFLKVRNQIYTVAFTAILMWSYTFNTYFTIKDFYHLHIMCWIYSIVHLLSPLSLLFSKSIILSTNIYLFAGFAFQFHYSVATGGFYTTTPVWFSILPLLAGIATTTANVVFWFIVSAAGYICLLIFDMNGFFGDSYTPVGQLWGQINITFGYIILNSMLILGYRSFRDTQNRIIQEQRDNIRNLNRIICHDISNPLAVIKLSFTQLIHDDDISQKNKKFISVGLSAMENIKNIIDHTRKLDALEVGKVKLQLQKVNLIEVLQKSINIFEHRFEDKELQFSISVPQEPCYCVVDQISLQNQVFNNILSNAIKFTSRGQKVDVQVKCDENFIRVIFSDTGSGIREDIISDIYDHSEKTTMLGTDGEQGTGFGLPIVKSIMDKMDASIEVISRHEDKFPQSHGTSFILSFKKAK